MEVGVEAVVVEHGVVVAAVGRGVVGAVVERGVVAGEIMGSLGELGAWPAGLEQQNSGAAGQDSVLPVHVAVEQVGNRDALPTAPSVHH